MKRIRLRAFALAMVGGLAVFACGNAGGGTGEQLASDQTLSFSLDDDIAFLDPGHVSAARDITFVQELFSGLVKFDSKNRIVPDLANGMPTVSADGKTYTFHLNKDAKFWNGDQVTSADVLYSWNRGAYLNDAYATIMQPVVGFDDTSGQKTKTMSGLTAPDPETVKVQLSAPAGYFLSGLALSTTGWIVDEKVIGDYTNPSNPNADTWWTNPATAVGSGPFKLTGRTPKASMDFAPVKSWWGGSTGSLTKVHVDIGPAASSALKKLEAGGYDLLGMGNQALAPADLLLYQNDPTKKKLFTNYASARSTWLGMNQVIGPFAPKQGVTPGQPTTGLGADAGKAGRDAFSKAISRTQLADVACTKNIVCIPSTGGYIPPSMKGYLGKGADQNTNFDAAAAKSEYQKWDADGSKVKGLTIDYNASNFNDAVWGNVQSQLRANLGVSVALNPMDFPSLLKKRYAKQAILFRGSWLADYDHPQDWFDNLFTCSVAAVGKGNESGYCNPAMDKLVQQADQTQSLTQAVSTYDKAQKMMLDDINGANLFYQTQPYVVQSYVKGAGYSGLMDWRWEGIRILKH
jgi:oligopeptide transport system substrate-binding protein